MNEKTDEKICHPFQMDHLPEYCYEKAMKELNETPETRETELKKLKDLLAADKLSTGIVFEDDFLQQFLRHRKYNSSRAFQYVQKYLTFRRSNSGMFESIPDEDFKGNPSTRFASLLPYRCPEGCAIMLCELGKWIPNDFGVEYFKRECISAYFQALRCPMTQINGFKVIVDYKDSAKLLRYFTPQNIYLVYKAAFSCIPARYKEIHLVDKSLLLTIGWPLFKAALSDKLRKRFFFHPNPEGLLNYFPKSILPIQYGGSLENYHDAELMRKINTDHGNCPVGGQKNYY